MRRRHFLGVLGGATTWPFAGRAQSSRLPRIGLLMLGNPDPSLFLREVTTGLREQGYEDGRNIALELRNAKVTDAGLAHLQRLRALERLMVSSPEVSGNAELRSPSSTVTFAAAMSMRSGLRPL